MTKPCGEKYGNFLKKYCLNDLAIRGMLGKYLEQNKESKQNSTSHESFAIRLGVMIDLCCKSLIFISDLCSYPSLFLLRVKLNES